MYSILANFVLIIHAAFVAFVVLTLPCIYIGKLLRWRWVTLYWLRVTHLAGICLVAGQAWAGILCPLTTLENWLRKFDGLESYSGSFIEYWLQRFLYWDLPAWVFIVSYSLFAILIIATWYAVPPVKRRHQNAAS